MLPECTRPWDACCHSLVPFRPKCKTSAIAGRARLPTVDTLERTKPVITPRNRSEGARARPSIEVALATYQSERFLRQLLDSLFAQTEQGFTLLIADDGSRDATMEIIGEYSKRHEGRIRIVEHDKQAGGAVGNFARLIDHASADYLFFCDHDDIWRPHKMALSLARMSVLEQVHGNDVPLLVHTDLEVVDEKLQSLGRSMFRYQGLNPGRNDLASLLMTNVVTGCTTLANRALYERARPIPPEALMHDHWLALVAATCGAIACIDEPTILYRQHGGNVVGAKPSRPRPLIERARQTLFTDERQRIIRRYSRQAAVLLRRYGTEMSADAHRAAATLAHFWSLSPWRRFARLRRNGLGLLSLVRNVGLLIVVSRGISEDDRLEQVSPRRC